MEPRGGEPLSLRHRAENHPVLEQLRGGGWGKPLGGVLSGQDSCSLANSEKLITEEVGKGDGVVETDTSDTSDTADTSDTSDTADTSDTLTPGEGGSWGSGGDFGGGRERLSAITFAAPGVWRRSLVNSEI